MKEFSGRVAVVTGGASGIGRGMAERFAEQGMKLVLADVEREPLDRATEELRAGGAEVIGVTCDVSSAEAVEALAKQTLDQYGAVHVLCNNAGVAGGASERAFWERSLDEWEWVMGVNLWGVVHGIRSFLPIMVAQDEPGHVVNTASMAGLLHGGGIYGVTKHSVVNMSESLYMDLSMRAPKVGVSVLCPGWVNTRIIESERNRPEAPREDPGEHGQQYETIRKVVEGLIASGLEPKEVGGIVVDAIRENRFYVLTHPWQNMITNRLENIIEGRPPVNVPPATGDWIPKAEE